MKVFRIGGLIFKKNPAMYIILQNISILLFWSSTDDDLWILLLILIEIIFILPLKNREWVKKTWTSMVYWWNTLKKKRVKKSRRENNQRITQKEFAIWYYFQIKLLISFMTSCSNRREWDERTDRHTKRQTWELLISFVGIENISFFFL